MQARGNGLGQPVPLLLLRRVLLGRRVLRRRALLALVLLGRSLHFDPWYYAGLALGAGFFLWQQWLIRDRDRAASFEAFRNNRYFGIAVFVGILVQYATAR